MLGVRGRRIVGLGMREQSDKGSNDAGRRGTIFDPCRGQGVSCI